MLLENPPLIGRRAELDRLGRLIAAVAGGVIIGGGCGVGKSRLAQEGLCLARSRGYATAEVRCRRSASKVSLGALAPLVGDLSHCSSEPLALLDRMRAALAALSKGRPVAVLVDDAHLLDEASAALIEQLVIHRVALVVATVESGTRAPEPLVALWRDGLAERLDVRPLERTELAAVISGMLGGGVVEPEALDRLLRLAGQNVHWLRELVLAAREQRVLARTGGSWRLTGEIECSPRLIELTEARLGPLATAERDVLELIAAGEPLEMAVIDYVGRQRALDSLERRGAVTVERAGRRMRVGVTDPLVSEVIRRQMPAVRQRAVWSILGEWLAGGGGRRSGDVPRGTLHRLQAGDPLTAGQLIRAASKARRTTDLVTASRLTRAAIEAGAGFDAMLLHADLAWQRGDVTQAETELSALANNDLEAWQRTQVALLRIDVRGRGAGCPADALRIEEEATTLVSDSACRDELAAARARTLLYSGQVATALRLAEDILARTEGPLAAEVTNIAVQALVRAGRPDEALQAGDAIELEAEDSAGRAATRILALTVSGRMPEAETLAVAEHDGAVHRSSLPDLARSATSLAWLYLWQGRVGEAADAGGLAVAAARRAGRRHDERVAAALRVVAVAATGAATQARALLNGIEADLGDENGSIGPNLDRARAWVSVAEGDTTHAAIALRGLADAACAQGDALTEAIALHDLARVGEAAYPAERLPALSATTAMRFIDVAATFTTGLANKDSAELNAAACQFEAAGMRLFAAEAAACAAVVLLRQGEPRRAASFKRRVGDLTCSLGSVATPALHDVSTQAMLTGRQLEIATLAAGGMANKAIAERLHLSVRTVETQLQRVYEKLGVGGRGRLRDVLEPKQDRRAIDDSPAGVRG